MTTLAPSLFYRDWDANGNPLAGGLVYTYLAGTTTPAATYTDSTGLTPNTNPVVLNARGEAAIWIPANTGYKFVVTDSAGNPIRTVDQVINSQLNSFYGGTDTGAANAYVLTYTAPYSAYADGISIQWTPANTNTGASTININSIGTVAITNPDGSALQAGQLVAGQVAQITYKAGAFRLLLTGTNPLVLPFLTSLVAGTTVGDGAGNNLVIGYRDVPANTQNANYTTLATDAGKQILHTDGNAYTYTINAAAAYGSGASIVFVNDASAAANITIAISGGTLVWSPSGSTGSRTLAQYGRALASRVDGTTRWYISGTGLT